MNNRNSDSVVDLNEENAEQQNSFTNPITNYQRFDENLVNNNDASLATASSMVANYNSSVDASIMNDDKHNFSGDPAAANYNLGDNFSINVSNFGNLSTKSDRFDDVSNSNVLPTVEQRAKYENVDEIRSVNNLSFSEN